ncbi:hypothetical protein HDV03_000680 [Kappamyces sp. JEL0829]|nr:hypothetical protein HDV03_000680 [Kappamyces sp. JEL0829]
MKFLALIVSAAALPLFESFFGSSVKITGSAPSGSNDLNILNFALTLEHLENEFYSSALQKFAKSEFLAYGLTEDDYANIQMVQAHEAVHVKTLVAVIEMLNQTAVPACDYDFSPAVDVQSFLAIARALERTGVSAYIGAAPLIQNPKYLAAAASIVTVEARHAALFNRLSKIPAAPSAFDVPLDGAAVLELALPFVKSCPFTLPIAPLAHLTIAPTSGSASAAINITTAKTVNLPSTVYCAFVYDAKKTFAPLTDGKCVVDANAKGDIYVFLSNCTDPSIFLSDNDATVLAGPAVYTIF